MIDVVCDNAVGSAGAVVALLVADKDVIGFFLRGQGKYLLLQTVDLFCFGLVDTPLNGIRTAQSLLVVLIGDDGIKGRAVTGGNTLEGVRVLHIFNAVLAEDQSPMCLGIVRVVLHQLFVELLCLVELAFHPQDIRTIEQRLHIFVIRRGNSLLGAAVFAFAYGHPLGNIKGTAAHFTLQNCHNDTSAFTELCENFPFFKCTTNVF